MGYANAHGTGTLQNDRAEALALRAVFGEGGVLVSSTKSLIGHALGAAGAIESVAAVLMLAGGFVHAARNCEDVHPEIAPFAASIPHETRELPSLSVMMKAGFGFGDVNAALVLRKWA